MPLCLSLSLSLSAPLCACLGDFASKVQQPQGHHAHLPGTSDRDWILLSQVVEHIELGTWRCQTNTSGLQGSEFLESFELMVCTQEVPAVLKVPGLIRGLRFLKLIQLGTDSWHRKDFDERRLIRATLLMSYRESFCRTQSLQMLLDPTCNPTYQGYSHSCDQAASDNCNQFNSSVSP